MINNMEYTYEFLRKCHGLRFKASRYEKDIAGVISVGRDEIFLCYGEEVLSSADYFHRSCCTTITSDYSFDAAGISDLEIVPRDPATYKDWQVGDVFEKETERYVIIFRCGEVVLYKDRNNRCSACPYTCEELYDKGSRLVLTDVEKQLITERQWEPQDGDVCYAQTKHTPQRFIFIEGHREYMLIDLSNSGYVLDENRGWKYSQIRPATDEEKKQLFDALVKKGKRWNAEKKCFDDIPKSHEFKKFDPVLVRDSIYNKWIPNVFFEKKDCCYRTIDNKFWLERIPLNEDTEPLVNTTDLYGEDTELPLGTTEDYKEGE